MKLKSFFAASVEAALGQARDELGSEAVLVNSRKAPPEARHLGEYEVVAAWLPGEAPARVSRPETGRGGAAGDARLGQQMAEIRDQLEKLRLAVWRAGFPAAAAGRAQVLEALSSAGVDPQLAHEIAACVEARLSGDPLVGGAPAAGDDDSRMRRSLAAEIERRLTTDPALGKADAAPRVVALVGPPGAGKTTTLAKLAVRGGLSRRLRVHILSLDTHRIASSEPLRTYASLLGVGLQNLPSGHALSPALAGCRQKDLVLIDTPGFGPRDTDAASEVASALAAHPEIDTHLILPATMKSADLTSAVDRFESFRPAKLLFTRVDETSSLGAAFSQAARTARPVSFLATGQQVPDDLEEAAAARLAALVFERLRF